MEDDEEKVIIVIDNGACSYLAGFAGDDAPRCCVRCVAGRRPGSNDVLCGDEAFNTKQDCQGVCLVTERFQVRSPAEAFCYCCFLGQETLLPLPQPPSC